MASNKEAEAFANRQRFNGTYASVEQVNIIGMEENGDIVLHIKGVNEPVIVPLDNIYFVELLWSRVKISC